VDIYPVINWTNYLWNSKFSYFWCGTSRRLIGAILDFQEQLYYGQSAKR